MSARVYTDNQLFDFHKQYIAIQTTLTSFAKKNNLKYHSLFKGFHKLQLPITSQAITRRKHKLDESFFDNISKEDQAYYLGLLYADGNIHERLHRLQLSLAEQDKDIVFDLSKRLLYGTVFYQTRPPKAKNYQRLYVFYVNNQHLVESLNKHGCVPRKTFILKFPELHHSLINHFVRGYFDGDGMLTFYITHNNYQAAQFSIVSTKEMLETIGTYIKKLGVHFEINKRHKNRDNNNFTLRVSGNQQIRIVCDWLYKDATVFGERKNAKYLKLIELTKTDIRHKHNSASTT